MHRPVPHRISITSSTPLACLIEMLAGSSLLVPVNGKRTSLTTETNKTTTITGQDLQSQSLVPTVVVVTTKVIDIVAQDTVAAPEFLSLLEVNTTIIRHKDSM
ncbi:hypothetical protein FRC20_005080, partial [Serendipita sp. 405]